ncbi:hypothetical protein EVAR_78506_1 [Eumeta japonica]|uniref:Uncharacterized protein n=1 Tax=Eumeta variegata TaxID=151549 RepID=A0A4C1TYE4_EUMVA|nr:hypothetical protein EVAR_78506_1 [Eumeta japonica]
MTVVLFYEKRVKAGYEMNGALLAYLLLASSTSELGLEVEQELKAEQGSKSRKEPESELKAGSEPKLRTGLGLTIKEKMGSKFKV